MAFSAIGAMDYVKSVDEERKRKEDLISARENALLDLYVKKGGTTSGDTDKKQSAAESAFKLQKRIDSSGIQDEETLNYLKNIISDPFAAEDVLKFIDDQAKNYDRVINLQDLHTLINIVKAPTSVQEKIDIFKEFELVDLSNKEDYYKLAEKVNKMTTKNGRSVFVDVNPEAIAKTDFTAREKQFEGVRKQVMRMARVAVDSGHKEAERIQSELNNLGSNQSALVDRAEDYLLEMFITPKFVQELEGQNPTAYRGLSKNHLIKPYLTTSLPQNQTTYPTPTQKHIESLKNNPDRKAEFEEKFGPGSADRYLKND